MPIGWDGVIILWAGLLFPFLLPPLLAVLFYWRAPRPKVMAICLSSLVLYIVMWAAVEVVASLLSDDGFYIPIAVSLVVAWGVLLIARSAFRRIGVLPNAS